MRVLPFGRHSCALALASLGWLCFSHAASACDPDHIESVTITDPIDIAQGGTGTATVTVTCIVTGSDLQAGDYQFDNRLVEEDIGDTTLNTYTYRAPGPTTDRQRARASIHSKQR